MVRLILALLLFSSIASAQVVPFVFVPSAASTGPDTVVIAQTVLDSILEVGSKATSITVSSTANRCLLYLAGFRDILSSYNPIDSIKLGTQHFSRVDSATEGAKRAEIWKLLAPTSGAGTVTVYFRTSQTGGGFAIVELTNVHQTTAITSAVNNNDMSDPIDVTISSSTGNIVFYAGMHNSGNTTTWGTGDRQVAHIQNGSEVGLYAAYEPGATSVTIGGTNMAWSCAVAVNVPKAD